MLMGGDHDSCGCRVNFANRFPIFSAQKEYSLDCLTVSRLAALRPISCLQSLYTGFFSTRPPTKFFCLFVFFSTPLFYSKVPSMDRHRICSVLSPDNSSHRFLIHSLRSVRVRIRTFLLDLIFRVPHFRNCQRRKQSAKNGHCRTQEISNFRFFIPTKNQCNKAKRRPGHEFIDSVSLHFFLRGLISNLSVQTKFYSSPRRLKVSRNFGYFRGVLL